MDTQKVSFPENSILSEMKFDYTDSYLGNIKLVTSDIDIVDIGRSFFLSSPKWVENLMTLRNKIVLLFGLKTGDKDIDRQKLIREFKGNPKEKLGLFKVYAKTENELILGEDDKHLDFRVSLLTDNLSSDDKKLTISTTVKFNNWFGKLYFLPVKPFHKLIVNRMLKETIKSIENKNYQLYR